MRRADRMVYDNGNDKKDELNLLLKYCPNRPKKCLGWPEKCQSTHFRQLQHENHDIVMHFIEMSDIVVMV